MDFSDLSRIIVGAAVDSGKSILANLAGYQTGDAPGEGETEPSSPLLGALGVLARPKPPDSTGAASGFAARLGDSWSVLALLDRRIHQARAAAWGELAEGAVCLASYLGQVVELGPGTAGGAKITIGLGPNLAITIDSSPGADTIAARGAPPEVPASGQCGIQ